MAKPCRATRACMSLLPYFSLNSPPLAIENMPRPNAPTTQNRVITNRMKTTVLIRNILQYLPELVYRPKSMSFGFCFT